MLVELQHLLLYSTTIQPSNSIMYFHHLPVQGLTRPCSRFVKLDPSIPDLSIPELNYRIKKEDEDKKKGKYNNNVLVLMMIPIPNIVQLLYHFL